MSFRIFLAVGFLFLLSCTQKQSNSDSTNTNDVKSESFEVIDLLVDNPNQINLIHGLLKKQQVVYKNSPIVEWSDELGTDYDFSNGNVVSMTLFEGNIDSARRFFNEVDSTLNSKYSLYYPAKAQEWDCVGLLPCMKYVNFYNIGSRKGTIALYIYSSTKDEDNVQNAQVVMGFGGNQPSE